MIDEKGMIEIIKKKVDYFYKNKIPAHLSLKTERFLNGKIKEINDEFFILDDFVEGEQPIFYIEILPNGIKKYKEKNGKNLV